MIKEEFPCHPERACHPESTDEGSSNCVSLDSSATPQNDDYYETLY